MIQMNTLKAVAELLSIQILTSNLERDPRSAIDTISNGLSMSESIHLKMMR